MTLLCCAETKRMHADENQDDAERRNSHSDFALIFHAMQSVFCLLPCHAVFCSVCFSYSCSHACCIPCSKFLSRFCSPLSLASVLLLVLLHGLISLPRLRLLLNFTGTNLAQWRKKVYQERGFWIIYNEQLFITIPFTKNSIYIIICGWRYES